MAHVRQQIRDRAAVTLTGLTTTGSSVYKSRRYALDDDKLPALCIYTMDEGAKLITVGTRTLSRSLNLAVQAFAAGSSTTIQDTIDTICVEVEEALAADFTLNGLAKSCVLKSTTISLNPEGQETIASAALVFTVEYVTTIGDVETSR